MPLAAGELLGAVIATAVGGLRRLDGLAVEAGGRRRVRATRRHPELATQGAADFVPGAVTLPGGEVLVARPPGREVVWQGPPRAALPVEVEDRVKDRAEVGLAWPTARLVGWEKGSDQLPLGVGHCARGWHAVHA